METGKSSKIPGARVGPSLNENEANDTSCRYFREVAPRFATPYCPTNARRRDFDGFSLGTLDLLPYEVKYLCMREVAATGGLAAFSRASRAARLLACRSAQDEVVHQNKRTLKCTEKGQVPHLGPEALVRYEVCASLLKDVSRYPETRQADSPFPTKHPSIDKAALFHWEDRAARADCYSFASHTPRGISHGVLARQRRLALEIHSARYTELLTSMSHVSRAWRLAAIRFASSAVQLHARKVVTAARAGKVLTLRQSDVYIFETCARFLKRTNRALNTLTAESLFTWEDEEARLAQDYDESREPDYDSARRSSHTMMHAKARECAVLNLSNRCLQSLPRGLESLPHLRSLDLHENPLWDGIARQIAPLINIRELDLTDCDISEIDGLESLHNLESLSLAGNRSLHSIGPLRDLPSLSTLILSHTAVNGRSDENKTVLLRLPLKALYVGPNFAVPKLLRARKDLKLDGDAPDVWMGRAW